MLGLINPSVLCFLESESGSAATVSLARVEMGQTLSQRLGLLERI